MSDSTPLRTYRPEEIQEILQLAIARQQADDPLSYEQLTEIAADLGITQDSLVAAEADWLSQRHGDLKRQEFEIYRRGNLQRKATKYAIANSFLLALDFLQGQGFSWSLYILLIWGLFLTLNTWKTFQTEGDDYEIAFQNWERKIQLRRSVSTLWQRIQQFIQG